MGVASSHVGWGILVTVIQNCNFSKVREPEGNQAQMVVCLAFFNELKLSCDLNENEPEGEQI